MRWFELIPACNIFPLVFFLWKTERDLVLGSNPTPIIIFGRLNGLPFGAQILTQWSASLFSVQCKALLFLLSLFYSIWNFFFSIYLWLNLLDIFIIYSSYLYFSFNFYIILFPCTNNELLLNLKLIYKKYYISKNEIKLIEWIKIKVVNNILIKSN